MSFGSSAGDAVAVAQLCFTVLKTLNAIEVSSKSFNKVIDKVHGLRSSLSLLSDILKPDEANHVLSQEQFQEPLRQALSKIRRDLLTLEDLWQRHTRARTPTSKILVIRFAERELEELVDEISDDQASLQTLLTAASLARNEEILLSLRTLTKPSDVSFAEEDIRIHHWFAGTDQMEIHYRLTDKLEESTADSILAESGYREWVNSQNSFFWLCGKGMPSLQSSS